MSMEAGAGACKAKQSSDNGAYSVFLSILEGVSLKTHDQDTANDTHNSQVLWDNSNFPFTDSKRISFEPKWQGKY